MHFFLQHFRDASPLTQVLGLLQLAFTIWMLVDAYQRRVEPFWYWVIFLFQPIGAWGYFFVIKFRTLRLAGMGRVLSGERRLSLDQLRFHVQRTPTVTNRMELAERLMDKGAHREAIPLLEAVLAFEPDYPTALHALAVCRLATDDPEQALAPLEKLNRRDPRWSNYRAWLTLVEVQQARGRPAEALAACREYVKRLPTLENQCRLAEHLLANDNPAEAAHVLDDALDEHHFSPWSARLRNWRWARTARRLLQAAEQGVRKKENTRS